MKTLSLIICCIGGVFVHAQETISVEKESVLDVSLYRGIVEVSTIGGRDIIIEHSVFDYDHFDNQEKLIPHDERFDSQNEFTIKKNGDTLKIFNKTSRELQYLKLKIPRVLFLNIEIDHFGSITVNDAQQPVRLQVFNGEIKVFGSSSSLSATVIRHGDIFVESKADEQDVIALSTYRGNISFSSSAKNGTFIVKTDLGEIDNQMGVKLEKGRAIEFENEGKIKKAFWYDGKLGNGKGPSILLVNTHGEILLKTF